MRATRAEGVRWANVSAFLVVRNLEKDSSLCVQAAIKASRSAAVGASGALVGALAAPACVAELDSCATNAVAASDSSAAKTITARAARRTTLVLCRGQHS